MPQPAGQTLFAKAQPAPEALWNGSVNATLWESQEGRNPPDLFWEAVSAAKSLTLSLCRQRWGDSDNGPCWGDQGLPHENMQGETDLQVCAPQVMKGSKGKQQHLGLETDRQPVKGPQNRNNMVP